MSNAHLVFVHAQTPLHPGTGQGAGVIDLPIAREKATKLPYLPGSSLKGVLRDACPPEAVNELFGRWSTDLEFANAPAGLLQFTDQRLLLLPVRSLVGTFAWVTSPLILRRFARDCQDLKIAGAPALPVLASHEQCLAGAALAHSGKVYLEEVELSATEAAGDWATFLGSILFDSEHWRGFLAERLCIVHDDVLQFLLTTAIEIIARVRIDDKTHTVETGGLWYEEALPAETILSGMMALTKLEKHKVEKVDALATVKTLLNKPMQLGGKATVGRGICYVGMHEGGQ